MEKINQPNPFKITPPRLFSSITAGFNTVANHIGLILLPVMLDILLWLGPHARLKMLLSPWIDELFKDALQADMGDMGEMIRAAYEMWGVLLERFNLFSALRVYPIGLPSLLVAEGSLQTPWGNAPIYEIPSFAGALGFWIAASLAGLILGSVYFYLVARLTEDSVKDFSIDLMLWQIFQTISMTLLLLVLMVIISVVSSLALTLMVFISPTLGQLATLVLMFVFLWLLVPLFFTPHGIYAGKNNFLVSMTISVRMVRGMLPSSWLFLLVVFLLSQGLSILWHVPPDTSWMTLVGVLGHAFISTGLLAATFVYYRGGLKWLEERQKVNTAPQQIEQSFREDA